jgi:CubicO group peptidase (beta-lactamase class C family)
MLPTSSCGTRLSRAAFGHTGFTGTSLWIDPLRDLYVVLLTNRVHPVRPADGEDGLRRLRPQVHDAVVAALAS